MLREVKDRSWLGETHGEAKVRPGLQCHLKRKRWLLT